MTDKPNNPISVQDVQYAYRPEADVLAGISLDAAAGKFLCILGPNGSGKTTLLRCILGQLKPTSGRVVLDGKNVSAHSVRQRARLMAYVAQNPAIAFAFNVQQIVMMGRLAHNGALGAGSKMDYDIVHAAMDMTRTRQFASRTLGQLSGGEAQCVMIARAIAQQPQVLLLDEPTSQLDLKNQLMIYRMMQRLARDWGVCVICVCHDINLASRFCDQMILMKNGQLVASGPPKQVITKDIISQTYDVETELIDAPNHPTPIVVGH